MFLVFQDVYLRLAVRISASVLVAALFGPVKGTDGGSAFSQKQEIIFWWPHKGTSNGRRPTGILDFEKMDEWILRGGVKFLHLINEL